MTASTQTQTRSRNETNRQPGISPGDFARTLGRFMRQWLPLLSPILFLLAWEAAMRGDIRLTIRLPELGIYVNWVFATFEPVIDPRFFARPTEIWPELQRLYEDGTLTDSVWKSSVRVLYGFVLGATPAVILGLLMASSRLLNAFLQPLAEAFYATPKIAFLPLVLAIYGPGEEGMVNIIAFSVFFLILLSVIKSVQQIDRQHYDVARSFGAGPIQTFFTVTLPASMPGVISSLQLGMGFALLVIVGTEFLAASERAGGIGYQIWSAKETWQMVRYAAALVTVGLMGYVLSLLLSRAGRFLLPWQPVRRTANPTALQRRLSTYWIAVRPWSFTATTVPILLGSIIAVYQFGAAEAEFQPLALRPVKISIDGFGADAWAFNWFYFALALIGALAFQAGTNLVNDYYDHVKGADNEHSLGIGGIIQRGLMSPRAVLLYGVLCFTVGSLIGLYLVSEHGMFILWLGIFSVLAGFFYTASPVALAYVGLGELTVGIFMGPVIIIGAFFVQTQTVTPEPLLASIPISLLVAAILHANNLRDLENDRQVGKRTLATLIGRKYANIEYYVLVSGAYFTLIALVVAEIAPAFTLIAFLTFPSAVSLMYRVSANIQPAALNPVLRRTAQLHMRFGYLMAIGWFFGIIESAYRAAI